MPTWYICGNERYRGPVLAGGGGGDDAVTTAWVAAVVAAGGTVSSTQRTDVNTLIVALKAAGVWAILDRLWLQAGESVVQQASIDLVTLSSVNWLLNASTLANEGVNFDGGAGASVDTGYNPAVSGPNYTINSAHYSIWNSSVTAGEPNGTSNTFEHINNTTHTSFFIHYTGTDSYARVSDATETGVVTLAESRGHLLGNRSSSTGREYYQNASSLISYGSVPATGSIASGNFFALTKNLLMRSSMISFGGSLSAGQVTSFYNALRTYMTAKGVP